MTNIRLVSRINYMRRVSEWYSTSEQLISLSRAYNGRASSDVSPLDSSPLMRAFLFSLPVSQRAHIFIGLVTKQCLVRTFRPMSLTACYALIELKNQCDGFSQPVVSRKAICSITLLSRLMLRHGGVSSGLG